MNPVAAVIVLGGLAALGHWPLVRAVLIPLGWSRAAWALTRGATLVWRRDRAGGAVFAGAWALTRQTNPSRADAAWLRSQIATEPVTPATLAALGLLASVRGDRDEARGFLEAALLFDERVIDSVLRRYVHEWLVAEAAGRGDWSGVLRSAEGSPRSARVAWADGVARRILDRPDAPDDENLEELWRRVPSLHRSGGPVMAHARAERSRTVPAPAVSGDPLQAALTHQVALLRGAGRGTLEAASTAWEAALATLQPRLLARAEALGARRGSEALRVLKAEVEASLAAAASELGAPLAELGTSGLLADAVAQVREEHLTTVELAAAALQNRLDAGRQLDVIDETREWLALARIYQDAVDAGGDEVRRLVFRSVYHPLSTLSVQLFNERHQRWLSNALTRWLLREARLAGDQRAVELQERNSRV